MAASALTSELCVDFALRSFTLVSSSISKAEVEETDLIVVEDALAASKPANNLHRKKAHEDITESLVCSENGMILAAKKDLCSR